MINDHQKNIATFIHLSTFSRFIIPFGNLLGPIVLWMSNKEKSTFIDNHGKQAINFQISILLYTLVLGTLTVPFFLFNMFDAVNLIDFNFFDSIHINIDKPSPLLYIGGAFGGLAILAFLAEILLIITASLKAKDGEEYSYPLTINFIK